MRACSESMSLLHAFATMCHRSRNFAQGRVGSPMTATLGRSLNEEKTVLPSRGDLSSCERGASFFAREHS
jgi:hypothetical protein